MFNIFYKRWNILAEIEYGIFLFLPNLAGFGIGISLMRGYEKYISLTVLGITSLAVTVVFASFLRKYLFWTITQYIERNYLQMYQKKFEEVVRFIDISDDKYIRAIGFRWRQYGRLSLLIWLISYTFVLILVIFNIFNLPIFLVQ